MSFGWFCNEMAQIKLRESIQCCHHDCSSSSLNKGGKSADYVLTAIENVQLYTYHLLRPYTDKEINRAQCE